MNSPRYFSFRNLHLLIAIAVVVPASLVYGFHPDRFWQQVLGLEIRHKDLLSIFKAIMGLYLAFSAIWILGILKPDFWRTATISQVAFMSGIAFGRGLSLVQDGIPSPVYFMGFFLEALLAFLGIFILVRESGLRGSD